MINRRCESKIRLAIIGCGTWGKNYVLAAKNMSSVQEIVIRRGNPLPRAGEVDAAVVAVHPNVAVGIACDLLDQGIPTMIEKPAGLGVTQARRLMTAESTSSAFVLVAHQHLFAQQMEALKRVCDRKSCCRGMARFGGPGPQRDYSAMWDYGPHAVSAALFLLGYAISVEKQTIYGSNGQIEIFCGNTWQKKTASVKIINDSNRPDYEYNGYAIANVPPLTEALCRFILAVQEWRTGIDVNDERFGAAWAVRVAEVIETMEKD